ncbi:MAG TPA: right-handed parallel beta-helix repeat-containing protein [Clostridia bacterium]|jgi:hypothetical protein|nr:right-handed parallel beta-helix repeat-containing protein [Clostridia bacterium]HQO55990.1 right-handed parallel beta-helix repeat-containing protein [Clostridia bacterium]
MIYRELLPNGEEFAAWTDKTVYRRTLHVSAAAQPGGDGSAEHPFFCIQQAADEAQPGDRILIHEGEYHETVRPPRGGKRADQMILYEGADAKKVIITGAEIYYGTYDISDGWKRSQFMDRSNCFKDADARPYLMKLPRSAFDGVNPFAMVNGGLYPWFTHDFAKLFHTKSIEEQKVVVQKRGMIFVDGERLTQVANYYEIGIIPGSFFVEDDGIRIHIRLKDDSDPADHLVEYTAREQCFCPEEKYCGYIHLKNITFERAGTGFPPPQRGAVSTHCGHHWLIEGCTVRDINGVGMDIGFQAPARMANTERGYMTVVHCYFDCCGFSGLVGTCGQTEETDYIEVRQDSLYVTDNTFENCCWQFNEESMEEAALKLHHTRNSVIARNYIAKTHSGCGMWLDASHMNMAVRENVILNTTTIQGAVFIECSRDNISFEHNVIANVYKSAGKPERGGNGLRTEQCEEVRARRNIFLGCEGYGLFHPASNYQRYMDGRSGTDMDNSIYENIIAECSWAYIQPQERTPIEGNLYGSFREMGYIHLGKPDYYLTLYALQRKFGKDLTGRIAEISYELDHETRQLLLTIDGTTYTLQLDSHLAEQLNALFDSVKA